MPSLTKDLTLAASNAVEIVHLPLDYHVLKTATLRLISGNDENNEAWTHIVLLSGGLTAEYIIAVLASGYCGPLTPVYWTGSIPVEADHHLAALVTGYVADQFRLSTILWKIRLDEEGEFRADP